MKTTVTEYSFRDEFRAIRPENFSYDALGQLFEFYESLEDDTGEEMELDVIAICCDWSECDLATFNQDYNTDFEEMDEAIEYAQQKGGYAFETDNDGETNILYIAF